MIEPIRPAEINRVLQLDPVEYELELLINAVEVENHNAGFYTALNQELKPDWSKIHGACDEAHRALIRFIQANAR